MPLLEHKSKLQLFHEAHGRPLISLPLKTSRNIAEIKSRASILLGVVPIRAYSRIASYPLPLLFFIP